tara:strand:- start:13049 stop:13411 length:363 start_codon:yes stop_codon:yes gene_type:complete
MSKVNKIKDFNNIMEVFLNQLSPYVGTSYYHYYIKLIKVNAILPIQKFIKHVLPYKIKIFEKDESYFNENNNYKINGNEDTLTEILRLQTIYYKLDKDSQNEVWNYMQALSILSEEYLKL